MGCDIHTFREKKINGEWVTDDEWVTEKYGDEDSDTYVDYKSAIVKSRNYAFFGLIADVRYSYSVSLNPKGLPEDVSAEVKKCSNRWDSDGHSHSWLNLQDVKTLITRTMGVSDVAKDAEYLIPILTELKNYLEDLPESVEEKRVVFWFDN